jgi:hypothetical protein
MFLYLNTECLVRDVNFKVFFEVLLYYNLLFWVCSSCLFCFFRYSVDANYTVGIYNDTKTLPDGSKAADEQALGNYVKTGKVIPGNTSNVV